MKPRGTRELRFRRSPGSLRMEVILAGVTLLLGVLAMTSSLQLRSLLHEATRERRSAVAATEAMAEQLSELALRTGKADDWSMRMSGALMAGGALGTTFDVPGLEPVAGAATCGTIELVDDETRVDLGSEFGLDLPRDLNGDGLVECTDVSSTAVVLPVILRVRWSSPMGDREEARGVLLSRS